MCGPTVKGARAITVGKAWRKESEAAAHFESTVWRQRASRKWGGAKRHQLSFLNDILPPVS